MWFFDLFRRKRTEPQDDPQDHSHHWTAEEVEAVIERAGRSEVFLLAEQQGWSPSNPPPLWVWIQIAVQVETRRAEACYARGQSRADGVSIH